MNIETLRYFQYIAKYENVTKAAKHFYISQSTLSRQIMALEKELGVTLFIRDNKKVELTEAGHALNDACDLFIKHMEVVIHNTQSAGKGQSGVLRIVSPGNLTPVLSKSLSLFRELHPDTELIIESYNFNEITSAILYDIYDIGFTYEFAMDPTENIEAIPVDFDDFSLVVSSEIIDVPSKENIAKVVKTMPLILPSYAEPPFIKHVMYELNKFTNTKSNKTQHVNTTESAMLQVSLGLGYSIVPTLLTRTKIDEELVTYFPLTDFLAKGKIMMLYKSTNSSKLVENFIHIVKNLLDTKTFE